MRERYYLKADHQTEWNEVTREQFIHAEQGAGFRSKFGPRHVATGGFSGAGMSGRVKYVDDDASNKHKGDVMERRDNEQPFSKQVAKMMVDYDTLVEQRDRLTRMLANVIDANYGTSIHHIGDGDGMPEEQAREIQEWWQAHLEQIRAEYIEQLSPSTTGDEQGGGESDSEQSR